MSEPITPITDQPPAPADQEAGFVPTTVVPVLGLPPEQPPKAPPVEVKPQPHADPLSVQEKPGTAPVHLGLSVDERAYQQYQALAQTVLDSADIADKSSEAALAVSGQLRKATGEIKDLSESGYKKNRLLLAICGSLMVICTAFFVLMGVRLVSRINQLDALMEAVGKRVIELNTAMESIENVNRSVQDLAAKQAELTQSQGQIEGRIDASLKQAEGLVQKVPAETAKQVAANGDSLMRQVQGINSRIQSQANAVQSLGSEVKSLKSAVGNVDSLKRDVESLITLQKERYLEALQKSSASPAKEKSLQYPRFSTPKSADAPPANVSNAAPAVSPASAKP